MKHRFLFLMVAVVAVLFLASCEDDPTSPKGTAMVRVIHTSYDAPAVDVAVDEELAFSNQAYGQSSGYAQVDDGMNNIMVMPAGTSSPVVIDADLDFMQDAQYTVLAVGALDAIEPIVTMDARNSVSTAAKVRFIHTSPDAPAVDIKYNPSSMMPVFENVAFKGITSYAEVPQSTYQFIVTPAGSNDIVVQYAPVALQDGKVYTIVAHGTLDDADDYPFGVRVFMDNDDGDAYVDLMAASSSNADLPVTEFTLDGMANGRGQTAFSCEAFGELVGYEGECPSVGVYEYTLWAGKHNDAGTVRIWADGEDLYVKYDTNETADLGEAHVYVWTDVSEIPTKRPAPGRAPYKAENINADSYTFTIEGLGSCGSMLYISTHAALVGEGGSGTSGGNAGETAYAGGPDSPTCFDDQKGAWWGYVNFMVQCFYDVSGTVYEDANNNADFDGETGFAGITVTATGADVYTTTTNADGYYTFRLPANESYVITTGSPAGDYTANENAGGYSIASLSECLTDIDFGFVPDDTSGPGPDECEFTGGIGSDGNSYELGAFFPYFIDGSIKFEGNSLGEDGMIETVTFTIYSESAINFINVATKSGNQSEDDTIFTYSVGDSFTDVGGYTISWDTTVIDPVTGEHAYTFTVTSDDNNRTPALSHISFYPNCPQ